MEREELARLAKKAGFFLTTDIERFASLVAAAERERCATVCEDVSEPVFGANVCAAAIRALT